MDLINEFNQVPKIERIVSYILLGMVGIMVVIDILLYINKVKGDTISNIIRDWVYGKAYFITFAWGVFTGHFFMGNGDWIGSIKTLPCLIILSFLLVALFVHAHFKKPVMKPQHQLILLVAGILYGHFFWSMNDSI